MHSSNWNKNLAFLGSIWNNWQYDGTAIPGTQPRKMTQPNGEKIDTSDVMMIIKWVTLTSSRSSEFEWVSWTHTTPCKEDKERVIERTSNIADTFPVEYSQQAFTDCSGSSNRIRSHYGSCLRHKSQSLQPVTISMGSCKKYVTPVLMHWSYVFLALIHRNVTQMPSFRLQCCEVYSLEISLPGPFHCCLT